jgi:hypothetical protein
MQSVIPYFNPPHLYKFGNSRAISTAVAYFDATQTFGSSGTTASIQYKSEMPHFTYDNFKLPSSSPYIRLIDLYPSHVESIEAIGAIHMSPPLQCRIH